MVIDHGDGLAGIRWVCLDVGETLIDETRAWGCWAEELGIPRLTLFSALGAVIARGDEHPNAFELLGATEWRARIPSVEARYGGFRDEDLYPDARRSIDGLRRAGCRIAILANQPASRQAELLALGLAPDVIGMSDGLGVAKPSPAFFDRALELMGRPEPSWVAYVGDRLDNDVVPARAAGMLAVWLRRGPWGRLVEPGPGQTPDIVIDSLDELVTRLAGPTSAPSVRTPRTGPSPA